MKNSDEPESGDRAHTARGRSQRQGPSPLGESRAARHGEPPEWAPAVGPGRPLRLHWRDRAGAVGPAGLMDQGGWGTGHWYRAERRSRRPDVPL